MALQPFFMAGSTLYSGVPALGPPLRKPWLARGSPPLQKKERWHSTGPP